MKGFTLIELSIVLIIISLIVGGIVGGRSLIKAAELNAVISDINKYKTAYNTFKDQYDAVPGDMLDAYDYWGDDCHSNSTICNGNGNNQIDSADFEGFQFWKQMQIAEMIPGMLTGQQSVVFTHIGVNTPEGPIKGTGFWADKACWASGWPCFGKYGNLIMLGKGHGGNGGPPDGAITPAEAKTIDKKYDDGAADGGDVRPTTTVDSIGGDGCITSGNPIFVTSGSYDLSNTDKVCRIVFFID